MACKYEGFKPENYYCRNICGDGIVVTDPYNFYSEDCEDLNNISQDGCYDCKF